MTNPKLTTQVRMNFDAKNERVTFYIDGHGRYGVKQSKETEALQAAIEAVYEQAVSLEVKL